MMVEESFLTIGLFCWLFLRVAREGEERQNLLDFANPKAWSSARRAPRAPSPPGAAPSCASAWRAAPAPPSAPEPER